jgi:acyl carrier protein
VDRGEVLRQVRAVGARLLCVEPDGLSDRAVFDDLDSLDRLELALAREEQLDVELPEEVVTSFETLDDLVDAVLAQLVLSAGDRWA